MTNAPAERSILVTGGAGYIGAHVVAHLAAAGYRVTVFDNLSRGHREAVTVGDFVEGYLRSRDYLRAVFAR